MSITALPNGRLRVQVYNPATGTMVSAAQVMGLPRGQSSFANTRQGKRDAKTLETEAETRLNAGNRDAMTVREFRDWWLSDPIFHANWKEGAAGPTAKHKRERTHRFVQVYGDLPVDRVDDLVMQRWLKAGNRSSVDALRTMFNVAMTPLAGRLIDRNPFANLGLERSKGNKEKQPPSLEQLERMIAIAWDITPPSFAAYLEFAAVTVPRPGELDALRPGCIDVQAREAHLRQQWNVKVGRFTTPKYGPYTLALPQRAIDVLDRMAAAGAGEGDFVFNTLRGNHYTPSTRYHHWNRVRCSAHLEGFTLYLATRHFFGWYGLNVLGLEPHVIAAQLGHRDGGRLVMQLYGHPDARMSRQKIRNAYDSTGQLRPLKATA